MGMKGNVEWSKQGLSPENAIDAWATAATTSVIISILLEEREAELEAKKKGGGK